MPAWQAWRKKGQKGIRGTAKEHLPFPNINPAEEAGFFLYKLSLFFKYFYNKTVI